jgi:hypothetical protein
MLSAGLYSYQCIYNVRRFSGGGGGAYSSGRPSLGVIVIKQKGLGLAVKHE